MIEKIENNTGAYTPEHSTIISRTTHKPIEISVGIRGNGLVPKNPFASQAQAGYLNANPEVLGKTALEEWNEASKGKKLPKRKHKK